VTPNEPSHPCLDTRVRWRAPAARVGAARHGRGGWPPLGPAVLLGAALSLLAPASSADRPWHFEAVFGKRFFAESDWETGQGGGETDASGFGAERSRAFGFGSHRYLGTPLDLRLDLRLEAGGGPVPAANARESLMPRGALAGSLGPGGEVRVGGHAEATWGMANARVDYTFLRSWFLTGGAGLGVAWVDPPRRAAAAPSGDVPILQDDDPTFAYQLGAGFGYRPRDWLTVSLHYRYLDTMDPSFDALPGELETEYQSHHNLFLGLRFFFD